MMVGLLLIAQKFPALRSETLRRGNIIMKIFINQNKMNRVSHKRVVWREWQCDSQKPLCNFVSFVPVRAVMER